MRGKFAWTLSREIERNILGRTLTLEKRTPGRFSFPVELPNLTRTGKDSRAQEFKNPRIQEWCDAELGARSLVLLEFLSPRVLARFGLRRKISNPQ
jgi:hypothetical protein